MPNVHTALFEDAPTKLLDSLCDNLAKTGTTPSEVCLTDYYTARDYENLSGSKVVSFTDWSAMQKRLQEVVLRHHHRLLLAYLDVSDFEDWLDEEAEENWTREEALSGYLCALGQRGTSDCRAIQPIPLPPFLMSPAGPHTWWALRMRAPACLVQFIFVRHGEEMHVHATPYHPPHMVGPRIEASGLIKVLLPQVIHYLRDTRQEALPLQTPHVPCVVDDSANPEAPEHLWMEHNLVRPHFHGIFSVHAPAHLAIPRMDGKVGIANLVWFEPPPEPGVSIDSIAAAAAFHEMRVTNDQR